MNTNPFRSNITINLLPKNWAFIGSGYCTIVDGRMMGIIPTLSMSIVESMGVYLNKYGFKAG